MLVNHHAHRGFTLIEMMVVLSIISIMMMLAAPDFTTFRDRSQLKATSTDLLASINLARSNALKSGIPTYVIAANGDDWSTGWIVFQDNDLSKSQNAGDLTLESHAALPTKITVDASTVAFLDASTSTRYIAFGSNGYPRGGAGGFQAGRVIFQIEPAKTEKLHLIVSASGRARICRPSDTGCDNTENN